MEFVCASNTSAFKLCAFSGRSGLVPPAVLASWKPVTRDTKVPKKLADVTCMICLNENRLISSHRVDAELSGSAVILHSLQVVETEEPSGTQKASPKVIANCTELENLALANEYHVGIHKLNNGYLFVSNKGNYSIVPSITGLSVENSLNIQNVKTGRDVTSCSLSISKEHMLMTSPKSTPSSVYDFSVEKLIWQADDTAVDFLNVKIPIWDLDCAWIDQNTFACSSAYGRVYIYDIRSSNKPRRKLELIDEISTNFGRGKYQKMTRTDFSLSLKHISIVPPSWDRAVVSSNTGDVFVIDLSKEKNSVICRLKGSIGATRDIHCTSSKIVIAGTDRFMRIYDNVNYSPYGSLYAKFMVNKLVQVDVLGAHLRKNTIITKNEKRLSDELSTSEIISMKKNDLLWKRLKLTDDN